MDDAALEIALTEAWGALGGHLGEFKHATTVREVLKTIQRLRSTQFRWIPVDKDKEPGGAVLALTKNGDAGVVSGGLYRYGYTHWAPIPPLPEKSQEEKDEELWEKWGMSPNELKIVSAREAFLAGVKCARENQKP